MGHATWDEVHKIRHSAAGAQFRAMVDRVTQRAVEALPDVANEPELQDAVGREFTQELIDELLERRTRPEEAIVNVALNLIPYGGVLGSANDAKKLVQEHRSWVSILEHIP